MSENGEIRILFATLLKVALFALLVFVTIRLWPVILMVIVAVLIAVMLHPLVVWLEKHRVRRGFAITAVAFALFAVTAAFIFFLVPLMFTQLAAFAKSMPAVAARIGSTAPRLKPMLDQIVAVMQKPPTATQLQEWTMRGVLGARYALTALTVLVLILVLAIDLLIEGRDVFEWLVAFAPPAVREKLRRTADAVTPIVFAYMRGQAITCVLCGGMALTTCLLLHVPAAAALAVLAFVADLVPVVGTIVMTVPAVTLALTVSPSAALIVLVVYLAYHLTESYVIIPRVYGHEMRLSTLAVLLAVTVGGALQGAVGAVLILPFVAAYPVVEKIWLAQRLQRDTVARHRALESAE